MAESYEIVSVKWVDVAESPNGWRTLEELEEFVTDTKSKICHQVGLLFEQDENQIVLVSAYFPNEELYGVCNTIPVGNIIDIKKFGKF
jgi:hypothetical protein